MVKNISFEDFSTVVVTIATYVKNKVKQVTELVEKKVDAAPADGNLYGQKDKKWVKIPDQQTTEYATPEEIKKMVEDAFKD